MGLSWGLARLRTHPETLSHCQTPPEEFVFLSDCFEGWWHGAVLPHAAPFVCNITNHYTYRAQPRSPTLCNF